MEYIIFSFLLFSTRSIHVDLKEMDLLLFFYIIFLSFCDDFKIKVSNAISKHFFTCLSNLSIYLLFIYCYLLYSTVFCIIKAYLKFCLNLYLILFSFFAFSNRIFIFVEYILLLSVLSVSFISLQTCFHPLKSNTVDNLVDEHCIYLIYSNR